MGGGGEGGGDKGKRWKWKGAQRPEAEDRLAAQVVGNNGERGLRRVLSLARF